ncbi:sugar-transfer associated ATP-grasp domain-containing protein [Geothrix limicola]|uniref:sugar-transfer associated ATP-grasp domain-containing protein n=1 Tax=Geothrix limicola TaxID=2927978 RepID=UPI0025537D6D|nr:sugar-transfer associated ATP-grasp domain-containing protein [Geothrix limicola]
MFNRELDRLLRKDDALSREQRREAEAYWRKYTRQYASKWCRFYASRHGAFDVRFVPDDLYYGDIDRHFNNKAMAQGVDDKNYYSLLFPEAKQPLTVFRKIAGILYDGSYGFIDRAQALELCRQHGRIIFKPAIDSYGGSGMRFWDSEEGMPALEALVDRLSGNVIAQQVIRQHPALSEIHAASLNTIRMVSLILEGEVHILSCILRMGMGGNRVDNASSGGITCGIHPDGRLKEVAFSLDGRRWDRHPQGFEFSKGLIPSFEQAKAMIRKLHARLGHFRLVFWDVAIDEAGEPVLIEANLRAGGLGAIQYNNGPLFGDLTDKVLAEVYLAKG